MNFWNRVREWLRSLFGKEEKSPAPTIPISTDGDWAGDPPVAKYIAEDGSNRNNRGIIKYHLYNNPDMNDREVVTWIMQWKFPNGMPVDWSWTKWAKAVGRPDPSVKVPVNGEAARRDVFDLGAGDGWVTVNTLADNIPYRYTYTVRPGTKSAEIYVYGAEGSQVNQVNGMGVLTRAVLPAEIVPGTHQKEITVQSIGKRVAVQLRQS